MTANAPSAVMEPEPVVLYNDPFLLCAEGSIRNQCSIVFQTINHDIIPEHSVFLGPNFYRTGNGFSEEIQTGSASNLNNQITCTLKPEVSHLNNNLQTVNSFHTNIQKDQPEFVDVNTLTTFEHVENKTLAKDSKSSIVVSDEENDVIFVKEYKNEEFQQEITLPHGKDESKEDGVRRNPMRRARSNKGGTHLQKEHLLEEDLVFLDQLDEESLLLCQTRSSSSTNSVESVVKETYKEWPINVHERPEYNPQTNKIEPFDYTIRDIQNKDQGSKKPRLETTTKAKRKPKKKYTIRKRRPKSKKPVEKVPIKELVDVVTTSLDMIRDYLKMHDKDKENLSPDLSKDQMYDLVKNQVILMAVVNNYDENKISECVSNMLSESQF